MFPPSWPRHVGQQVSFGLQLEHTRWPAWHCGERRIQCERTQNLHHPGQETYLKDWGENIVKANRAFEEGGKVAPRVDGGCQASHGGRCSCHAWCHLHAKWIMFDILGDFEHLCGEDSVLV